MISLIDANKVGGWVRATVASLIALAIGKWPLLGLFLSPEVQTLLAAIIASVAVGLWSQLTKTDSAKISAVEALPEVKAIVVAKDAAPNSAAAEAAHNSKRPKVVTRS